VKSFSSSLAAPKLPSEGGSSTPGSRTTFNLQPSTFNPFLLPLFALLIILQTGCKTAKPAASYHPDNFHRGVTFLPKEVQRVALLPIACAAPNAELEETCQAMASIISRELIGTKKFEVIPVPCEAMLSRTRRMAWSGVETLPTEFFEALRDECGCDAVLFAELTTFKPYSPMAIGWRFKLVDVRTKKIIWATDELFDASVPSVANAARQFDNRSPGPAPGRLERFLGPVERFLDRTEGEEHWAMLNSPAVFGEFTVASLLTTLPER
jgi:hypothetical protein